MSEGTIDLNTLLPADTDNQIFRIAVLPAAFANDKSLDINNLNLLMNSVEMDVEPIKRINISNDRNL